jgi:hypothetical protein
MPMTKQQGTSRKFYNLGMMVVAVAIAFAVSPSRSFSQNSCGTSCNLGGTVNTNSGQVALTIPAGDVAQTSFAAGIGALAVDTADYDTGVGNLALTSNTTGEFNTATGESALEFNTTGPHNTADGTDALVFNTTGGDNTAMGYNALGNNTTSGGGTAIGFLALNLSTGTSNTALGSNSCSKVTTASNVLCLGPIPGANLPKAAYIAFVYGTTIGAKNAEVCIDSTGRLGTANCPTTAAIADHQETINQQQEMIRTQAQQIADLQQRLGQLESMIGRK